MNNDKKRKATVWSILGLAAVGAFALRMDDAVFADENTVTPLNPAECIGRFGTRPNRDNQRFTDQERQQFMEENNLTEEQWQERETSRRRSGMMHEGRGFNWSENEEGASIGPRFDEEGQFGGMMGGRWADGNDEFPSMNQEDFEEWMGEREEFRKERWQEVHPDWNPFEEEAVDEENQ